MGKKNAWAHCARNPPNVPFIRIERAAIAAEIERLIALLDAFDGDPDCEPDADDEPDGGEELFWQENLRGGGR